MSRYRASGWIWAAFALLLSVALGSCKSGSVSQTGWEDCAFDDLTIDAQFPGARASGCRREGPQAVAIRIEPENSPINPSPWYAFRVTASKVQSVELILHYAESRHRYAPKLSYDGESWFEVHPEKVEVNTEGSRASVRVVVGPEPLWISAQEIFTNERYEEWTQRLAKVSPEFERRVLGSSLEGRQIWMVDTAPYAQRAGTVVVVGRQHPPEVTGAFALMHFVEHLLSSAPEAQTFRKQYRLVVVPNLNPDGVAHGHWRHNRGGIDLNRDWGPFTQPETRLMRDLIAQIAHDPASPLTLVLDFHSTWRDLMYTQRDEEPTQPPNFTSQWIDAIRKRLPDYALEREPENSGVPSARTYVYREYGVPSITYEVGDRTDRASIAHISREAAAALIDVIVLQE